MGMKKIKADLRDMCEHKRTTYQQVTKDCSVMHLNRIIIYLEENLFAKTKSEIREAAMCLNVYSGINFLVKNNIMSVVYKSGNPRYCLTKNLEKVKEVLGVK